MKHHLVFVASAICAFASVAPMASAQPELPDWAREDKAIVIVTRIVNGQLLTTKQQAAVIVARNIVPSWAVPNSKGKTSPMIRKPESRYQYLGSKLNK